MTARVAKITARSPIDLAQTADFDLGAMRVRPAACEIEVAGAGEHLEPRVMQVLVALSDADGEVVSRDDLIARCWSGVVVGDDAINRVMVKLRRLSKRGSERFFKLETIPRVGYRLRPASGPVGESEGDAPAANAAGWQPRVMSSWKQRWRFLAAGAALLAVGAVSASVVLTRERSYVLEPMQMVAHSRRAERQPALSPDGRFIAYTVVFRDAINNHDTELAMRAVSGGEEIALTDTDDYNEWLPAFSPSGDRLAYARWRTPEVDSRCEIMVRDFPNGLDRRVGACESRFSPNRIGWTRDGRSIIFTDILRSDEETSHIRVLDLETGDVRDLVPPPPRGMGDLAPAMSPDGTRVAFMRYESPNVADVYVYETRNQRLTRVTNRRAWAQVAWADARNLFVISNTATGMNEMALWRADGRGGARPLLPGFTNLLHPTTSQDILAVQVETEAVNLWRSGARGAAPITEGNQIDGAADFSPDGTLAFLRWQSGVWVYIQPLSGQPRRLARLADGGLSDLRWSPDGRRLIGYGLRDGRNRLFIVDAASGMVQPVRIDLDEEIGNPSWSADGESLIFASTHVEGPRLMRLRLDATTAQPISGPGWVAAVETRDGLFAISRNEPGIWRLAPGRAPELMLAEFRPLIINAVLVTARSWVVSNGRFYVMDQDADGRGRIRSRAIAGGPMAHVADLDELSGGALAVDPTTGDVVYQVAVDQPQSDIAIIPYRRR